MFRAFPLGRKIANACTGGLNDLANTGHLVSREVVHHDDVAGPKRWREDAAQIDKERFAIHRAAQ